MPSSVGSDADRERQLQAAEDARQLELIRQDPPGYFTLPKQLVREGGPFVMIAIVNAREGCGPEVVRRPAGFPAAAAVQLPISSPDQQRS
jgi:hypothetical protein